MIINSIVVRGINFKTITSDNCFFYVPRNLENKFRNIINILKKCNKKIALFYTLGIVCVSGSLGVILKNNKVD